MQLNLYIFYLLNQWSTQSRKCKNIKIDQLVPYHHKKKSEGYCDGSQKSYSNLANKRHMLRIQKGQYWPLWITNFFLLYLLCRKCQEYQSQCFSHRKQGNRKIFMFRGATTSMYDGIKHIIFLRGEGIQTAISWSGALAGTTSVAKCSMFSKANF
jgi:hypothetical protein